MASRSGIFVGLRAPPATADATSIAGMPTKNTAAVPNFADMSSTAKPANVIIAGCVTFRGGGLETAVRVTEKTCRNPKNRLQVMSDTLTKKLRRAATLQHMN